MIGSDVTKLEAPRRARDAWTQVEMLAAQALFQTLRAIVAAHEKHSQNTPALLPAERMEAALAGLIQAYALTLTETGLVIDLEGQRRVMQRGLLRATLTLREIGQPREDLEGVFLAEFEKRGPSEASLPIQQDEDLERLG